VDVHDLDDFLGAVGLLVTFVFELVVVFVLRTNL